MPAPAPALEHLNTTSETQEKGGLAGEKAVRVTNMPSGKTRQVSKDRLDIQVFLEQAERLVKSGQLTPNEIKDLDSNLRSMFAKALRTKAKPKSTVVAIWRRGDTTYKLRQRGEKLYWYKGYGSIQGEYVGRDTPETRKENKIPLVLPSETPEPS